MTDVDAFAGLARSPTTVRLRSGRYLDLADPKPDQFTLADVAGGLSKLCRFGGQTPLFYSVAEHSWHCLMVAVADGLPLPVQRAALLHDAAEAFVGDLTRPIKRLVSGYGGIEHRVAAAVMAKCGGWGLDEAMLAAAIDHAVLFAEKRALFGDAEPAWPGEASTRRVRLELRLWSPAAAEEVFLAACDELGVRDA